MRATARMRNLVIVTTTTLDASVRDLLRRIVPADELPARCDERPSDRTASRGLDVRAGRSPDRYRSNL